MKKLSFLLCLLPILTTFSLFSQEFLTEILEGIPDEDSDLLPESKLVFIPDSDVVYIINSIEFNIKGHTRPDSLIRKGEFKDKEEIKGPENMEKFIRDKTQLLYNQRVLDSVQIDYIIMEPQEDGAYLVTLTIKVEDSWNIIALPKPGYSTNTGFELTIKARDYNFLGTMNPLRVDLGYHYDENKRSSFLLGVYSDTPFKAFGYNWNVIFNNTFSYRPEVDEPFYYQNTTGLSMELPFRSTTFTFGFNESFNVNEENEDRYKIFYHEEFQRGLYMSSTLYTSWKIPTGLMVSRFGELTYTPEISATFNHEFPQWPLLEFNQGPFMGFSHSLGFEKIDWHSNYRDGLSVFISNVYTYDFFRLNNYKDPLSVNLTLNGTGHFIIRDFFAISTRLMYRHWFYHDPDYYDQAGDALRGISDKSIYANYMLSLNIDFPFRVLLFTPSIWFNNRKFRFFDIEFQLSPVIDMALFNNPVTKISFNPKNIVATGGLELIMFPEFMRSLYLRFGYALNLRKLFDTGKLPGGENRDIYLIMGHFY